MQVNLCTDEHPTILYPQATLPEDFGGQVRGFVELNCSTQCTLEAVRVRLLGFEQTIANDAMLNFSSSSNVMEQTGMNIRAARYDGAPRMFFMREVMLRNHITNETVEAQEIRNLDKGKNIFTFSLDIPRQSPASQFHALRKVYYELVFFIRGRAKKKLFGLSFTHAPSKHIVVECHPSQSGSRGLNAKVINLIPSSAAQEAVLQQQPFKVTLESNNARFGGCFTLRIYYHKSHRKDASVTIDNLMLKLEQHWSVRGSRIESTKLRADILNDGNLRSNNIESTSESKSSSAESSIRNENGNLHDSEESRKGTRHTEERIQAQTSSPSIGAAVQCLEYHGYFPDSNTVSLIAEKVSGDVGKPLRTWQASTPTGTNDEVKVEHMLFLEFHYSMSTAALGEGSSEDAIPPKQSAKFRTSISLVKESMRTDAIQLPQYSMNNRDANAAADPNAELPPPPPIDEPTRTIV